MLDILKPSPLLLPVISLVHATVNKVTVRFSLFGLGTLAILVLAVNRVIQLLA